MAENTIKNLYGQNKTNYTYDETTGKIKLNDILYSSRNDIFNTIFENVSNKVETSKTNFNNFNKTIEDDSAFKKKVQVKSTTKASPRKKSVSGGK